MSGNEMQRNVTGRDVHVVLAGGGTAGHVNPLLAIASAIRRQDPNASVSVLGTAVGLEHDLVPHAGFELDTIEKVPFPRRPDLNALRFPARWIRETRRTRAILAQRNANVVVGVGGYASAPAYSAAHRMGIPIVIHEQNARAGMANRLGARWADFIGTAYEHTGLKARDGASIERVGLPLRSVIADLCARFETDRDAARVEAAAALGVSPDRPLVLVTGGSQGALSINRAVASAAKELLAHAQIIHLTGRGKDGEVRRIVAESAGEQVIGRLAGRDGTPAEGGDYRIEPYLERIDLAFACADLVICRSGAGMVGELAALGLPAIYVPLPFGNGEQRFNAQPVVDADGGLLIDDRQFTGEWVRSHVPGLLADRERLTAMGQRAWRYGIRDAADIMARHVLELARSGTAANAPAGR